MKTSIKQRLFSRRSVIASATTGLLITALIAGAAIIATGYTAQHFDLGDGSVWVANSQRQAVGRANTEVLELNSVISTTGSDLEVVQEGATVLLLDRTEARAELIDPVSSEAVETVALPPNKPELYLAQERVVIFEKGTGKAWILPVSELESFDSQSSPSLNLGADAIMTLDPDGLLFAYTPSTEVLYRVDTTVSDVVESTSRERFTGEAKDISLTSVNGKWVAFDAQDQTLHTASGTIELSAMLGDSAAVLQKPSSSGSRVLIGYSAGLLAVPMDAGSPVRISESSGSPVAPTVLDGCEFAAWTSGTSWRRCAGDSPSGRTFELEASAVSSSLGFLSNGSRTVLSDRTTGETWAVQRSGELINNWDDLITRTEDTQAEQQNTQDPTIELEKTQQPPVAVDDTFGARPRRSSVLPVLLNDYDANGDALVVEEVVPIDPGVGRVEIIAERQQIQITLEPSASGRLSFRYTITDGRGGSASATVTVDVRSETENSPPNQARLTTAMVEKGGRVTTDVLGDWVDPDGDPFYLVNASVAPPDAASYRPNGSVVFSDSAAGGELKPVTLVVSDGTSEASGSLVVTVRLAGEVPIVADPFVLTAYSGQEITVSPLEHVRGGTGPVRLNNVPARAGVTVTPSYETGTFRFLSAEPRSHYLEYIVTDGNQTVTGLVRIDVKALSEANAKPITVPKTVFVNTLSSERIDVTKTDVDPAGGVLIVTGVTNLPVASGVRAEVLEQHIIRISLDALLDSGPVTFNYRISNGLAEAEGSITVIQIPAPDHIQPPVAKDDTATVRVGEVIDIPVLANDEHPDGLALTLQSRLEQELPEGSGLLFVSDNALRFLAPQSPGNVTASYRVTGPDGQAATATVRIAVREADPASNNAPIPEPITARVLAGETVRIRIPLTGIDPDGDSVQLLGQSSNPEHGSVAAVESDTIVYHAGDYSAGTDSFSYSVIDSLGARASGVIRVGISPRLEGARNPVAVIDEVTVRPGVTVSVRPLSNDSDPDGGLLRISSVAPNDSATEAEILGDLVRINPPQEPGTYGVIYSIENAAGGTSHNFIRVRVSEDAPLSYPIALDSVLTLSDIRNRDAVVVDVLSNVFFADGDPNSLGLSVYPGYGDRARVSNKRIEVTISNKSQIIPFVVTHPEDDTIASYAFIRVPGFDEALPQIDQEAQQLSVNSGSKLVIDLNDYVIAVEGKQVRLTGSSTVEATHANGESLVADEDTLVFTSADKYFGPASISFEVTDGSSASDPEGHKATLVLPIAVLPRDNQPPVFGGASLDFEPEQERVIDLIKLTNYPYPGDHDELSYSMLEPLPDGFSYSITDNLLTIRADSSTAQGTEASLGIGVRDSTSEGKPGRIDLHVVASTRPVARPAADSAIVNRGGSTTVDVLANDQATNPFPDRALRVVDVRGADEAGLPAGVTLQPSADKSSLSITVAPDVTPRDINLQYQVADATNDPSRYVWGSVTVSIQDKPEPVSNLVLTSFGDRELALRWNAGASNNSPITSYQVTATASNGTASTTSCSGTTCVVPTVGNGPGNAVSVAVAAVNAIGASQPTTLVERVWSDIIPPPATGYSAQPLDHGLRVLWDRVPDPVNGSAVTGYLVTVGSATTTVSCSASRCSAEITDGSLSNGVATGFSVSARNGAYGPLALWNTISGQGTPAGAPIAVAAPLASSRSDTAIALSWGGAFENNGQSISNYYAAAYTSDAPSCTADGTITENGATVHSATGTSIEFSGLSANTEYSFIVFAVNGQGCTASSSAKAYPKPGVVTGLGPVGPVANGDVYDFVVSHAAVGDVTLGDDFVLYYRLNGGSEHGPVAPAGGILAAEPRQFGSFVSVTVRACRIYSGQELCQDTPSQPFTLGVPVDPRVSGLSFSQDSAGDNLNSGTFRFTGLPSGSYEAILVSCGTSQSSGIFTLVSAEMTCHADAGPADTPLITFRVIANQGKSYDISYNGFDYD